MLSWLRPAREPNTQPTDAQRQDAFWQRIDKTTQEGNRALGLDARSWWRRQRGT